MAAINLRSLTILEVLVTMAIPLSGHAAGVTPSEMLERDRWVSGTLGQIGEAPPPAGRLEVVTNNDTVQQNARLCRPLRMAGRLYRRGLFCHAPSQVRVHLSGPGARFEALVGVDSNEQTSGGRGSVVFAVTADGAELFRSPLLREDSQPVPVSLDLRGATEISLLVEDGGDGIACDQANWAEAKVTLADGGVLWLGDMPLQDPHAPAHAAGLPFSFIYGGRPSSELLPAWKQETSKTSLEGGRTELTRTYTDPDTGLELRFVAVQYSDFPVVEWTLHFRNGGERETPILQDVRALDSGFSRYEWPPMEGVEFRLHHFTGSPCRPDDYRPHVTELRPGQAMHVGAAGGRPTNSDLCFFNLEWPSEGVIIAVGWPGQWASSFTRDDRTALRVEIGQELLHTTLHPGETIRSPLIALLFWKGDWIGGQNLWRRWMLQHNLPRPGGKLPPAPQFAAASSYQFGEMVEADEQSQVFFVDRYLERGLKLDYWWMDAGWYVNESGWPNTGTWEVDRGRFPNGLRVITDHARKRGVRSILWFEPERVTPGTWLYDTHPEWLLGQDGEQKLLNLGDPAAVDWWVEHASKVISEQGIDLYRTDFNIDPLPYWRGNDAEDRQGITENHYVTGFLAYLDALSRRFPSMLMDTCASGGRRNDLETLRRMVPLHRSDHILEPTSGQCQTYGIAHFIPFFGAGQLATDTYSIRSVMGPHFTACWDMRRDDLDDEHLAKVVEQWKSIAPNFLGDYYPLTPYSLEPDVWLAWQFDRPEVGEGVVAVYRRPESIYEAARLPLRGLEETATYEVHNIDEEAVAEFSGAELIHDGIPVRMSGRPQALYIVYQMRAR